jgi:aspartokinase
VKSIALKEDMVLVRLSSRRPVPVHRSLWSLGETLDRHEVSPHLLGVSGHRVVLAVEDDPKLRQVLVELGETLHVSREEDCGIVSLVGDDAGTGPRIAAQATGTLGDVPILFISYGVSDASLSLVVSGGDSREVVANLHREFFGGELPEGVFTRAGEEVHR